MNAWEYEVQKRLAALEAGGGDGEVDADLTHAGRVTLGAQDLGTGEKRFAANIKAAGLVESTSGGVKFPDGSIQTTVAQSLAGMENQTDSTMSFVDGTRVFTVTKASTSFSFWTNGVKYTKTTAQTTTIANTVGPHFIYFDAAGALQNSMTPWDIASDQTAPVAIVHWTGSAGLIAEERHCAQRDRLLHKYLHQTRGTAYDSGFVGTFTDTTLSITGGVLYDEDIRLSVGSTQTQARIWKRDGSGDMVFGAAQSLPYADVAGTVAYDDGSGTLQAAGAGAYVVSWVYGTNYTSAPIAIVPSQASYATLALARAALQPAFPGMSDREWKLLYAVIYRNPAGLVEADYIEQIDYRTSSSIPSAGTSSLPASSVTFTPTGSIAAVDVQSAIAELDGDAVTAIGAVGSTPNANAGSIATNTLTLELANASYPGLLSAADFSKLAGLPAGVSANFPPLGVNWRKRVVRIQPKSSATATAAGFADYLGEESVTGNGTMSSPAIATTNLLTSMPRGVNTATASGSAAVAASFYQAGSSRRHFRGNGSAGVGGFHLRVKFAFPTIAAQCTWFCGFTALTGTHLAADEFSVESDIIGFGQDSGDTNIQVMHNYNAGSATKVDSGIAAPAATDVMGVEIYCAPNASSVWVRIEKLNGGASYEYEITTNLPLAATLLKWMVYYGSGPSRNVAVAVAFLGLHIESDY